MKKLLVLFLLCSACGKTPKECKEACEAAGLTVLAYYPDWPRQCYCR